MKSTPCPIISVIVRFKPTYSADISTILVGSWATKKKNKSGLWGVQPTIKPVKIGIGSKSDE